MLSKNISTAKISRSTVHVVDLCTYMYVRVASVTRFSHSGDEVNPSLYLSPEQKMDNTYSSNVDLF